MTYSEVLANARECIGKYCKACPVCNGVACKNQIPGPGAKGVGDTAIRNYNKWADIRVNMDTLCPPLRHKTTHRSALCPQYRPILKVRQGLFVLSIHAAEYFLSFFRHF